MGKTTRNALMDSSNEGVKKVIKRKPITIDVLCSDFKMLFATDFNPNPVKKSGRAKSRSRSTRSKTKERTPVDAKKKKTVGKVETIPSSSRDKMVSISSTGFTISEDKPDVLGTLNTINGGESSKKSKDTKRGKRKRFPGDDNDIAAENIPLEAVFPALQFGVINKDICPKKRRRLQSLVSPKSPRKFPPII